MELKFSFCKEDKTFLVFISILTIAWLAGAIQRPVVTDEAGHMGSAQLVAYVFGRILGDPGILFSLSRLKQTAFDYYAQHPNVTILFHPPFLQILTGFVLFLFGPSVLLSRLVSVSMSLLCMFMMYLVGRRYYSPRIGLYSSILLGSTIFMLDLGSIMFLDISMLAMTLIFLYFFLDFKNNSGRRYFYLLPLFLIPLIRLDAVLIFLSIFVYVTLFRDTRVLREKQTYLYGLPLFFILVVPFMYVFLTFNEGDFISFITGGSIDAITSSWTPLAVVMSVSSLYYSLLTIPIMLLPLFYFYEKRKKMKDWENYLFVLYLSPFLFLTIWSLYSLLTGGSIPWTYISSGRFFSSSLPSTCLFTAILLKERLRDERIMMGLLSLLFAIQLMLSLGYVRDYGYNEASLFIWDNIAVHGNVLSLEYQDGIITPFSMMDSSLEHTVLRARECVLANLTYSGFKDYLNENNVQYIVSSSRIHDTDATAYLFTIGIHDQMDLDPEFEKHIYEDVIVFENMNLAYPLSQKTICQQVCYVTDAAYCAEV